MMSANACAQPRRPIYETAEHLKREREIAMKAAQLWSCEMVKTKTYFCADYAAKHLDKVAAMIEIKDRAAKYSMDQLDGWGGVMVSGTKWGALYQLSQVSRLPTGVIVETFGAQLWVHWATPRFEHDGVDVRGRYDRGDWQDIEPVILLRRARFELLT
jgi:hypothetical protein